MSKTRDRIELQQALTGATLALDGLDARGLLHEQATL